MGGYYQIKNVTRGIYKITEPLYLEHANNFLIVDRRSCLLFDCGLGLVDIVEFLNSCGFLDVRVTVTHCHFDHIGGLRFFHPKKIIIPSFVYKNLTNRSLWALECLQSKDFDQKRSAALLGKTAEQIVETYDISLPLIRPYTDKSIQVGHYIFEVIESPGHTDDSIVFFEKEKGILISGDTFYDGEIYNFFPNSNKTDYQKTLRRLMSLNFKLLLPGHNRVLEGRDA